MSSLFTQVKPSKEASVQIEATNQNAECMLGALAKLPDSREKSLAVTKLEECVMWANKCAARNM